MFNPRLICMAMLSATLFSCQKDDSSLTNPTTSGVDRPFKKDVEPPVVAILNPQHGTAVWDTYISVGASDDVGLKKVEILEDGKVIHSWQADEHGRPVTSFTETYPYNPGIWDIRNLKAVSTDWTGKSSAHEITVYKLISCCMPSPAP